MDFRAELRALGYDAAGIEPMGGGCVSSVYLIRLARGGGRVVVKHDEDGDAALPVEADMLRYLAGNTNLPVPQVLDASNRFLVMEYIPGESRFGQEAERHAADLLAELHGLSAPAFGFGYDTLIGGLRQPNPPSTKWIDFFRQHRLRHMASEAFRAGRLPASVFDRLELLCERLDEWLEEPDRPSLIHGDVWNTNILSSGGRITGFLDPAIYFAHSEIELAFTTLFHTFGPEFYERYSDKRPIAPAFFEIRRDIYNLYPLLVHVRLFGGSYVSSVVRVLERFGA